MSTDIGSAWMSVLPTAKGFGPELSKLIAPQMGIAGLEAGKLFGGSMKKGLEEAGIVGVAVGIAGTLFKTGSAFQEMQNTMRVGLGATGSELAAFVKNATNVGTQIPASFAHIGEAIDVINDRLGLTGKTLETFTKQALEAGRITKTDLDLETISGALTIFGIKGKETTGAMDDLFKVFQKTGAGINTLATAMKSGAPVLQAFGFGFKDSAALLGALDKAGVDTQTTLMALKIGFINFAKAGRDPEAALKATITQMEAFSKVGDKISEGQLAAKIFGTRGASAFIAAVNSGKLALDGMFTSIHAGTDTIIQVGKETQYFSEQMAMFKEKVLIEIKPASDAAFASITKGMTWLNTNGVPILKDASHWLADNKTWLVAIVKPLGEVYLAWKALVIIETVSKAMVGFVASSKIVLGVTELYNAAMAVQMAKQIAVTATTTAATLANLELAASEMGLREVSTALNATMGVQAAAASATSVSNLALGRTMLGIGIGAAAKFTLIGTAVLGLAEYVSSLNDLSKKGNKSWLDWTATLSGWNAVWKLVGMGPQFGKKGNGVFDPYPNVPITQIGAPGAAGAGGLIAQNKADAILTAKNKAAAIAAAKADAAIVAANLKAANAAKVATAAAKAIADKIAILQLQTAVEDQKKIMSDFARWVSTDFVTSFTDASAKAADIISGIMSQVGSAITGHAATISDPIKSAQFTLGATKISNKLETDLLGYAAKLDDINKQRTDIAAMIPKAQTALDTSNAAMASLVAFMATPFGTPSDIAKAFSGATATVDSIISGYDSLTKMVQDRFTTIDSKGNTTVSKNADYLLTFLKDQSTRLVALVAQRVAIADKLKIAQTDLENVITIKANFADSLSNSLKSVGLSLTEFVTSVTLADGRIVAMVASPSALIATFAKRLTAIKTFATNVKALAARGLGQDIIGQITGMGADSGGALAASLVNASDSQIAALQATSAGITDTAKTLGNNLSDTFYGSGVSSAKAIRDGLQSQQDAIDLQMTSITNSITDKLAPLVDGMTSLGTDSAAALLAGLKSKDAALLGWAQGIGAQVAQAIADSLVAINILSGGNNFGTGIVAFNEAAAKLQAAADVAALKAAQEAADALLKKNSTITPTVTTPPPSTNALTNMPTDTAAQLAEYLRQANLIASQAAAKAAAGNLALQATLAAQAKENLRLSRTGVPHGAVL